ncbi:hypothetical protein HanRHA438_Chr02g0048311 [Helianthus annuus]|nr:hypothetical protein HanRHA438_Chr02g0048311 [Helianthus annuus]
MESGYHKIEYKYQYWCCSVLYGRAGFWAGNPCRRSRPKFSKGPKGYYKLLYI